MHWSLRMLLDTPKAVLLFRKTHRMMSHLHKVDKKEGTIASFKAMQEYPLLQGAQEEIYIDMLSEVMEKSETFDTDEMEWFLKQGELLGIIKRVVEEEVEVPDNEWKEWEEQ